MKSAAGNPIIHVSKNAAIYRGFTITKLQRTALQQRARYAIFHEGNFFGYEFAGAEAMRFIDRLHAERGAINAGAVA